jgi:hypothetical protein
MAQLNSLLVTGDSRFLNPINGNARNGIYYVKGTQTAATGAWTGNIPVPALYDGLTIMYYLPYAGSGNATLNLTLSTGQTTGAKNCYYSTSRLTTHYGKGCNIVMTYHPAGTISVDGTATTDDRWVANANYDSNSDLTGYNVRNYYNSFKAGANKIFPYTIIMQNIDGRWESIVTSSSTGTSKTRNTHGFVLGQIAVMNANATYNENAVVGNSNVFNSSTYSLVDHRYSFNTANNSTSGTIAQKPIYLVGAMNSSDGLFYLDATWWTQTLPSTEDGKLYIYLGDAYDYYRMTFAIHNPIYHYANGKIRQITQDALTINGRDLPSSVGSATTGISIAAHGTTNIYGVQSSTTTASKVTLGTAISVPNVTSAGSASNWVFENITVPKAASSATSIPNVTAVGSGSFTATVTNGVLSFSHTHTAPTLGTAISVTGVSGSTTASHVKSGGNGTAPTLGTAISVPNVTAATDVTVPIKNASATAVVTGTTHTVTDNGHTHTLS